MNVKAPTLPPSPTLPAALRVESGAEYAPGERQLLDAARRATTYGWAAMVVHLGQFPPPGPRPHHLRIARAIIEDAALRQGGQVFILSNGDLVLLCPAALLRAPAAARGHASADETLPDLLGRLLRAEAAETEAAVSIWPLPENRERLLGYAVDRLAESGLTPLDHAVAQAAELPVAFMTGSETRVLPDLLLRQTGVLLGGPVRIRPLYREITYATAALQAEAGTDSVDADPYLLRHFAIRMEERVLAALPGEADHGGALDLAQGPPLHLNLAPSLVTSAAFAALADICRARGVGLGVEITLVDAAADLDGYIRARDLLAARNIACVLDQVSQLALTLTCPATLAADFIKLDWSPRLTRGAVDEAREQELALSSIGVERIILAGADSEAAMQWGLGKGIKRFQGRHVDAMLAASRIAVCPQAAGCTLRQCTERASAVAPGGRNGCHNTRLLDSGMQEA